MKKAEGSPILVSIAVHIAIAALILPVALGSSAIASWFSFPVEPSDRGRQERIRFVQSAPPRAEPVANGTDKVNGGRAAPPAAPVAPPSPAAETAPINAEAQVVVPSANGVDALAKGDGSEGPLTGIRPSYVDPRLWAVPAPGPGEGVVAQTPGAVRSKVDSLIREGLLPKAYMDSLGRMNGQVVEQNPGDWTMKGPNGERWGMDQGFIRLGKFSIPTVLLALLPFNTGQMNVQRGEEDRRLARNSAEIRYQTQRMMNEDEFRSAVRRVRERKDRERAEQLKRNAEVAPSSVIP